MKFKIQYLFIFCVISVFTILISSCSTPQSTDTPVLPSSTIVNTPTPPKTSTPTASPQPSLTPTVDITSLGQSQPIPTGVYYLGEPGSPQLGFNMDAGGAISNLLYNGVELVDSYDYGRYIQFSPYEKGGSYTCDGNTCFEDWSWNPIQAGSAGNVPAVVTEFKTWQNGVYIKSPGMEWGKSNGVSDVIYETWAWDRGGYFEVITRLNHIGDDSHGLEAAEFPAIYTHTKLRVQYGVLDTPPFSAQDIQVIYSLNREDFNNLNEPVAPSERWLAYSNKQGDSLVVALPEQPFLTPLWDFTIRVRGGPNPVCYMSPIAYLEVKPGDKIDLHYFLIPGDVYESRAIVYDIFPHTPWTFNVNSLEGWRSSDGTPVVEDGTLKATVGQDVELVSADQLNFYGNQVPVVEMKAASDQNSLNICLHFTTNEDPFWNDSNKQCASASMDQIDQYRFDFSLNPEWQNGQIKQLKITADKKSNLSIDEIKTDHTYYGWDFSNPNTTDGWAAWWEMSPVKVENGSLVSSATGEHPYMISPYLGIDAYKFETIEFRMKTNAGTGGQVFFGTTDSNYLSEKKQTGFELISDGEFHTYTIDMSVLIYWNGSIPFIRIDPINTLGDFEIDYIHILP